MEQINNPSRPNGQFSTGSSTSATPAESIHDRRNVFNNEGYEVPSSAHSITGHMVDPFASPLTSRPVSAGNSSALDAHLDEQTHRYFHSRRVPKGNVEKPWLQKKETKERWVGLLPVIGILIGLAVSAILVWDGVRSVAKHKYCLVMSDDFSSGFRTDIWNKEVQVGGFGNGEFEETTADEENVFVKDGNLWILPTLQDASLIENDSLIDLLANGSCTSTVYTDCVAATNTTSGNSSIVPPTRSGRITTKGTYSIKYGRVEVTAKTPKGDWLWPAIWMMPVEDTYGAWPASGEIDLMESRGNNHTYTDGGNNIMSSTLHWGPSQAYDAYWRTNVKHSALHTTFSDKFHKFGLEWSQKYLFTYVNSRLMQVLYNNFDTSMWDRGDFPDQSTTDEDYVNVNQVWAETGRDQTPFDQPFYLILNVAVGGTNGWFADSTNSKPWLDDSSSAAKDFWEARSKWYPTWTSPQMEISQVDMWQQCDGDEDV